MTNKKEQKVKSKRYPPNASAELHQAEDEDDLLSSHDLVHLILGFRPCLQVLASPVQVTTSICDLEIHI